MHCICICNTLILKLCPAFIRQTCVHNNYSSFHRLVSISKLFQNHQTYSIDIVLKKETFSAGKPIVCIKQL